MKKVSGPNQELVSGFPQISLTKASYFVAEAKAVTPLELTPATVVPVAEAVSAPVPGLNPNRQLPISGCQS